MKIDFYYAVRSRFLTLPMYEVELRPIAEAFDKTKKADIYNEFLFPYIGEFNEPEVCDMTLQRFDYLLKNAHLLPSDSSHDGWIFRINSPKHVEIGVLNPDLSESYAIFTLDEVNKVIEAWGSFLRMPKSAKSRMELRLTNTAHKPQGL